jgi:UDP-MurNAc hydroxylase
MTLEIEYVTHASLHVRSPDVSLLVDPFYYPERDPILAPSVRNFPPRVIDAAAFGPIDYLFSSHEHHDHCHPETLVALRHQVRHVLLPADRPVLEERYRAAGYRDITFLQNRRPLALPGGLEVTAYWDDPVDSILLVRLGGKLVLHANDCLAAAPTFAEIARRGTVDYAFMCSTSTQELYPLLLPRGADELEALARAREEQFFAFQLERIAALDPRVVLPYSYTAAYLAPDQLHLNGHYRITPPLFRDRLRARNPAVECWSLQPGDVIDAEARAVRPLRAENLWGDDLDGFRAHLAETAAALAPELPSFDPGEPEACDAALRAHLERRLTEGVPHAGFYAVLDRAVVLHVAGRERTLSYHVDLARGAVTTPAPPTLTVPLELTFPAALMQSMLARDYDPFMILYTYRIVFRPAARLLARLTPQLEYFLYLGVVLSLFMDRDDPRLGDIAGLERLFGAGAGAGAAVSA